MADTQVLDFVTKENKPYNVQLVADMLAQYGIKKPSVQRALESLAEAGQLTCKEFGKTKIFFPIQEQPQDTDKEEIEASLKKIEDLKAVITEQGEAVQQLQKEAQLLQSTLTDAQLEERLQTLSSQASEVDVKLKAVQGKSSLISKADWDAAEQGCQSNVALWAKRRRIFNDLWGTIGENVDTPHKMFLADLGVETDESHKLAVSEFQQLAAKRPRG